MKVVAVVPAYNEEKNIGAVIDSLKKYVDHIVVVDDCSSDNTFEKASVAGVFVLRHGINRGQGAALQTGNDYAKIIGADYVIHFDADGQMDADCISQAVSIAGNKNSDVVFGSRYLGVKNNIPFLKKYFIHPIAKLINKLFFGIVMSDAHCGFRLLSRNALHQIEIKQDGMAHATEIPGQVMKKKLSFSEFPIKVVYKEYGQNSFGGIKVIKDLFIGSFLK